MSSSPEVDVASGTDLPDVLLLKAIRAGQDADFSNAKDDCSRMLSGSAVAVACCLGDLPPTLAVRLNGMQLKGALIIKKGVHCKGEFSILTGIIMKPIRIQRRRTKGYDMQAVSHATNGLPCVSVTRPGRWGNPFSVEKFGRELSMKLFRNTVQGIWSPELLDDHSDELCDLAYAAHHAFLKRLGNHPLEIIKSELAGKNLACYCPSPLACHADILLEQLRSRK